MSLVLLKPTQRQGYKLFRTQICRIFLVPYDESGNERPWTTGNFVSRVILRELRNQPVTDVFIFSHGWRGDVDDAKTQYNSWVTAMANCDSDLRTMHEKRPIFAPFSSVYTGRACRLAMKS